MSEVRSEIGMHSVHPLQLFGFYIYIVNIMSLEISAKIILIIKKSCIFLLFLAFLDIFTTSSVFFLLFIHFKPLDISAIYLFFKRNEKEQRYFLQLKH